MAIEKKPPVSWGSMLPRSIEKSKPTAFMCLTGTAVADGDSIANCIIVAGFPACTLAVKILTVVAFFNPRCRKAMIL
jgi:hypothetical protein